MKLTLENLFLSLKPTFPLVIHTYEGESIFIGNTKKISNMPAYKSFIKDYEVIDIEPVDWGDGACLVITIDVMEDEDENA